MGWKYAIHAERITVPHRLVVEQPDSLSFDHGVFAALAATAVHAVDRGTHLGNEKTLVVGLGLVGQLVLQLARAHSRSIVGVDPISMRRGIASQCGADHVVKSVEEAPLIGYDRAYICLSGEATTTLDQTIRAIGRAGDGQPRGAIIMVGRFDAKVSLRSRDGQCGLQIRVKMRCRLP